MADGFDPIESKFDKFDATVERNSRAFEDLRISMREDRLWIARAMQAVERSYERMEQAFDRIDGRLDDLAERSHQHTLAIRSLLDRLGEGPTPTS